jgi:hypothetical protein
MAYGPSLMAASSIFNLSKANSHLNDPLTKSGGAMARNTIYMNLRRIKHYQAYSKA